MMVGDVYSILLSGVIHSLPYNFVAEIIYHSSLPCRLAVQPSMSWWRYRHHDLPFVNFCCSCNRLFIVGGGLGGWRTCSTAFLQIVGTRQSSMMRTFSIFYLPTNSLVAGARRYILSSCRICVCTPVHRFLTTCTVPGWLQVRLYCGKIHSIASTIICWAEVVYSMSGPISGFYFLPGDHFSLFLPSMYAAWANFCIFDGAATGICDLAIGSYFYSPVFSMSTTPP